MQLTQASKADAEVLSAIHKECFPNYWNIEAFNDFFAVGGTHALLAGDDAGMMVYRVQFDQADIITLAVKPAFRRQGLARSMAEKALAHMQQLGAKVIFLDVEDGNVAAIKLYESMGFEHERRRKLYYRQKDGTYTDALVMKKKIQ